MDKRGFDLLNKFWKGDLIFLENSFQYNPNFWHDIGLGAAVIYSYPFLPNHPFLYKSNIQK